MFWNVWRFALGVAVGMTVVIIAARIGDTNVQANRDARCASGTAWMCDDK
jgi:hypothetical protein